MSIFLILLALVVCGALLFIAIKTINKAQSKPAAGVLSVKPTDWEILFSPTMPSHPELAVTNGAWFFDFPDHDGVHYILTSFTPKQTPRSISMTFKITGNGTYTFPGTGNLLPSVRFMVGYRSLVGRWWSNPISYALKETNSITLTAQFQPDKLSDVDGKFGSGDPERFKADINNIKTVGMTFGGGNAFGHGVWLKSGKARFTLIDFKIT